MTSLADALVIEHWDWAQSAPLWVPEARSAYGGPWMDALRSAAVEGLWHAAQRYDPSRQVAFRSFAKRRVAGAVVDEIRQIWPGSRHGRGLRTVSGDDVLAAWDRDRDDEQEEFTRDDLSWIISHLTDRERYIVQRRYFDGVRLRQIGIELGLTEGRVSQIVRALDCRLHDLYLRGF